MEESGDGDTTQTGKESSPIHIEKKNNILYHSQTIGSFQKFQLFRRVQIKSPVSKKCFPLQPGTKGQTITALRVVYVILSNLLWMVTLQKCYWALHPLD